MKTNAIILLAILLQQYRAASEEISVASGNSAGESIEVIATGPGENAPEIERPEPVVLHSVERMGSHAIRLSLIRPVIVLPNDTLSFFRAKNSEAWQEVTLEMVNGYAYNTNAPAGNEYQYVAFYSRVSSSKWANNKRVFSAPSTGQTVADATCSLLAWEFGVAASLEEDTGFVGQVDVGYFIPNIPTSGTSSIIPPNPYQFVLTNNPNTGIGSYPVGAGWIIDRQVLLNGFVRSGFVADIGGSFTAPFSPVFVMNTDNAHRQSVPFGSLVEDPDEGPPIMLMDDAKFAAYHAEYSGDPAFGYDAVSNPSSQMVPAEVSTWRNISVRIFPEWAGESGTQFTLNHFVGVDVTTPYGTPSTTAQPGEQFRIVKGTGDPSPSTLWVSNMSRELEFDVRKRRVIKIKLVDVRLAYPTGASPGNPGDPNGPWVLERDYKGVANLFTSAASVQAELNNTFGKQANVWFSVSEDPNSLMVPDLDSYITMEEAKNPVHDIYTRAGQNRNYDDGYFTIFRIQNIALQYTSTVPVGPPRVVVKPFYGGIANDVGHPDALFAIVNVSSSVKICCHEIGHLLGLNHTWIPDTSYCESNFPDDARRRLMCYDCYPGTLFVVKPERDTIHETLDSFLGP